MADINRDIEILKGITNTELSTSSSKARDYPGLFAVN